MVRSLRFLLAAAAAVTLACNGSTPAAPTPDVTPAVAPTPMPEPTPTPTPGPGLIAYIRVGFYGVECNNGQQAPSNNAKKLPVGCYGYVTATPKQANGADVDAADHGPDIEWELVQGEHQVRIFDVETQAFNKVLRGRTPGAFSLCATVRTVRGCLDGQVI
jgi:hypothetical protein